MVTYRRGFSLLELMITLVVVGILAAVSYPSYINHIQKTRRSDAITSLLDLQAQLERCYANDFSYQNCANALELPIDSTDGVLYY